MKCIDTYFSNILKNEKYNYIEKEYIIPNKFDLRLVKDEIHFIKEIYVKVYYPDCDNLNSIFINYINITIGNNIFYERGKNEILCLENKDEYMKYEIYFPTSKFFTNEKHILILNNLFSFYKIKIVGYLFDNIETIVHVPLDYMKGTFYNFVYDHHSNYFKEGIFICKSDYKSCYVNYIHYCPNWYKQDYNVHKYRLSDIEDYKSKMQELKFHDNDNNKYILFFVNIVVEYNELVRLSSSQSLHDLFFTYLKPIYKTYMIGAFYRKKLTYTSKTKDFDRISFNYNLELLFDGIFKIKINNILQTFLNINSNVTIEIKHLEFNVNINDINSVLQFDSIISSNNMDIVINVHSIYEKYFEILDINLACVFVNDPNSKKDFLTILS